MTRSSQCRGGSSGIHRYNGHTHIRGCIFVPDIGCAGSGTARRDCPLSFWISTLRHRAADESDELSTGLGPDSPLPTAVPRRADKRRGGGSHQDVSEQLEHMLVVFGHQASRGSVRTRKRPFKVLTRLKESADEMFLILKLVFKKEQRRDSFLSVSFFFPFLKKTWRLSSFTPSVLTRVSLVALVQIVSQPMEKSNERGFKVHANRTSCYLITSEVHVGIWHVLCCKSDTFKHQYFPPNFVLK